MDEKQKDSLNLWGESMKLQWHFTGHEYLSFLKSHAEMTSLYVEGTLVDGVEISDLLDKGIVREVVPRRGKIYLWTDFFSLAFVGAENVLQRWAQTTANRYHREDVELYLEALNVPTVLDRVLSDGSSFNDENVLLMIKAMTDSSGLREELSAFRALDQKRGGKWKSREDFMVAAKICSLVLQDRSQSKFVLSELMFWIKIFNVALGMEGDWLQPTVREYLSVFPGMDRQEALEITGEARGVSGQGQDEVLRMVLCDDIGSVKFLEKELCEARKGKHYVDFLAPAGRIKSLFSDEEWIRSILPDYPMCFACRWPRYRNNFTRIMSGALRRLKGDRRDFRLVAEPPGLDDFLRLSSVWAHTVGDIGKAAQLLGQVTQQKFEPSQQLALAIGWKNICGDLT